MPQRYTRRRLGQIAAEVIVPLNRAGGNGTGFRAQLLFFLDDLIPPLFCSSSNLY
jgi:hypothetical protein